MSKLEYCLWGADFVIGGIGYLVGGTYAGLVCFFIGGILILTGLTKKDKSQIKIKNLASILVDDNNEPYIATPRIKRWHKWALGISIASLVILAAYGIARHASDISALITSRKLSVEWHTGAVPTIMPTVGRFYVLQAFPLPIANGGGGLMEMSGTPGQNLGWPLGLEVVQYTLTNYSPETIFNVNAELRLEFRKAVKDDHSDALRTGNILLSRGWPIYIAKIDPGPEHSFVFYVMNFNKDNFVGVTFPESVTGNLAGATGQAKIPVIETPPSMMGMMLPPFQEIIQSKPEAKPKESPNQAKAGRHRAGSPLSNPSVPADSWTKPQRDNSVHIGEAAKIEQQSRGDCSPNIIGGSTNFACNSNWHLDDSQRDKWSKFVETLPASCADILVVGDIPDKNSHDFASDIFGVLDKQHKVNRMGHLLAGDFGEGLTVEVHDENDISVPIAKMVMSGMQDASIPVAPLSTNPNIRNHEIHILVAYKPSK